MPVHAPTMRAMSSASTSSLSRRAAAPSFWASAASCSLQLRFCELDLLAVLAARRPGRSRRRARPLRSGAGGPRARSWSGAGAAIAPFSCSQRLLQRPGTFARCRQARARVPRGAALDASSFSLRSASRSISSWMRRRSSSSSSTGIESISMRSRLAASSTRSMALSGRNRFGDVAVRQDRGSDQRRVGDAHAVVHLVALAQAAQDRDRLLDASAGRRSTGWKRRSSAASFSMCLRYSSSVVAPIVCSSPRASIGLSRLDASIAPSAAPAPTTVCSSSMNRTIWPSESLISLSTAFRRSSNSPRNFAPATNAPRSSATTRFSFSPSGTSPRTMRCASPSTMAVLPTPGSPISTGLFLVRRDSTWMTRRISSSRPMTGSSLPGARVSGQVAAVLLQRLVGRLRVLRCDALAAADLLERLEDRLVARAELFQEPLGVTAGAARGQAAGAPSRRTRP